MFSLNYVLYSAYFKICLISYIYPISSKDYVPSGFGDADSKIEFGDFELKFTDKEFNDNAKNALKNVLAEIDKDFWRKYKVDDRNIKVSSNGLKF